MNNITSKDIRDYNNQVKVYQQKAGKLLQDKNYAKEKLIELCKELSELTGQTVTPENLEMVYQNQMSQFQQTLKTGREIIERAKAEEASLANGGNTVQAQSPVQTQTTQGTAQTPFNQMGQGMAQNQFGGQMGQGISQFGQPMPQFGQNMGQFGQPTYSPNANQGMGVPQSMPQFNSHGNSPFGQE